MKNSPTFMTIEQRELLERILVRADQNDGVAEFLSSELWQAEDTERKTYKRRFMFMARQGEDRGLWSVTYSRQDFQGVQLVRFVPHIRVLPYIRTEI